MSYKTTDGLMRHLRDNGIDINGSKQKRQLINSGYYHGYKGYRFFGVSSTKIPFTTYDEVNATIIFDSKLKSLLYPKVMMIETAIKSISIDIILQNTGSESIQSMYSKVIDSYTSCPSTYTPKQKKDIQQKRLNLQNTIQGYLSRAYKEGNPKITHFYNNLSYNEVPLWALFEIMTLGDVGYLLSCLTFDTRDKISKSLGLNLAVDTNRELVYQYIYSIKDLRNAIAHNAVVFDTRFRKSDPSKAMTKCLELEVGLPYFNFKTIGDYVVLVCYYLKLLRISKTEIKAFVKKFEKLTAEYVSCVSPSVASTVIHPDLMSRMQLLNAYLN